MSNLAIGPTTFTPGAGISGLGYVEGFPVTGSITSPFGPREPILTPVGWTSNFHSGIDLWEGGIGGSPIHAGCDQVVTAEGPALNGYGNCIFAKADSGHQLLYAHMREGAHAGKGQRLRRGDTVGLVGTTGASTGDHLHFGVLRDGLPEVTDVNIWIDPNLWVNPTTFFTDDVTQPITTPPLSGGLPHPGQWALLTTTRQCSVAEIKAYLDADPTATERGLYMLVNSVWVAYIFGAPSMVNAVFPDPLPANTGVLVMA